MNRQKSGPIAHNAHIVLSMVMMLLHSITLTVSNDVNLNDWTNRDSTSVGCASLGCSSIDCNTLSYQQCLQEAAQQWQETNTTIFTNTAHSQTLLEMILLCHKITQEACDMLLAKHTIQEELLKIYTPSLIDSWQTNMQAMSNDTTKLEQALHTVNRCQENLLGFFDQLKLITPHFLHIKPQPTQTMITNLKQGLLIWTMQQTDIAGYIDEIQTEFTAAVANIDDIKTIFSITLPSNNTQPDKNNLKQAAGCVSKTYKDLETVLQHFTAIRKTSIYRIKDFFASFFKIYYTQLYEHLTAQQLANISKEKLPAPHEIFVACDMP